jgi:hypothetical protein
LAARIGDGDARGLIHRRSAIGRRGGEGATMDDFDRERQDLVVSEAVSVFALFALAVAAYLLAALFAGSI